MPQRDIPTTTIALRRLALDDGCRLQHVEVVGEQISRHPQIGPQLLHGEVTEKK